MSYYTNPNSQSAPQSSHEALTRAMRMSVAEEIATLAVRICIKNPHVPLVRGPQIARHALGERLIERYPAIAAELVAELVAEFDVEVNP